MKQYFPPKYQRFHCIAGACPDSCCKEWDVVIDVDSEAYYQTISGELGKRLHGAMVTDEDGDTIFQRKGNRCPFWNLKDLCDIQLTLGEGALCDTCRLFPRITQDYGDFVEYDLSIACPEAARLLLTLPPESLFLTEVSSEELPDDDPEYDPIRMEQLRQLREQMFHALRDTTKPALVQLEHCLALAAQLQSNWDENAISPFPARFSSDACISRLLSCNILSEEWRCLLTDAAAKPDQPWKIDTAWDAEIRAYAFDFLYRCLLREAFDQAVLRCIEILIFSVHAVCTLIARLEIKTQPERLRIWQQYVKEIEYDPDNLL